MPKRTWRMADGIPLTEDEIIEQCDPAKVMKDYGLINETALKSFVLVMRYDGLCADAKRRARECLRLVLAEGFRRDSDAIASSIVDELAESREAAMHFFEHGRFLHGAAEPVRGKIDYPVAGRKRRG